MGFNDQLAHASDRLLKPVEGRGVETVVTPCADCYYAFKRLYPEHAGSTLKVVHMTELLDELVRDGKLKFKRATPMRVTYHDPCHLGRQGETMCPGTARKRRSSARRSATTRRGRGTTAPSASTTRRAMCSRPCPGSSWSRWSASARPHGAAAPAAARARAIRSSRAFTANERIEEAEATGADALVTACPWCERNFIDAVSARGDKLRVLDIMQLVEQAL